MDPSIFGTLPPEREKFGKQVVANADGSLSLEVYRLPENEHLVGFVVRLTDPASRIRLEGTRLTGNVVETADAGMRVYSMKLLPGLPPGVYQAHRYARRGSQVDVVEYAVFSFRIPDTPFNVARAQLSLTQEPQTDPPTVETIQWEVWL